MKVKQLQINSFRGFDKLNLEFNQNQPTVFIGINGAGKSTILDCLAILLSLVTAKIENSQNSPLSFNETDIKNGSLSTHNEITISGEDSQEFRWSLSKVMEGNSKEIGSNFAELEVKRTQSSFGRNSDRILEYLMATPARPQEIKENLLELFQLIEKGDLEKAQKMRQNIVDKIGGDEPELVKAGVSIRRKEILNR